MIASPLNSNLDNLVYSLCFHTCVWPIRDFSTPIQPHKNRPTPTQAPHPPSEQNKHTEPPVSPLSGTSPSLQLFLTILHLNPCSFAGLFSTDLIPEWCEAPAHVATPQFPHSHHISASMYHLTISLQAWLSLYCYLSEQFSTLEFCPVYFSRWHRFGVFLTGSFYFFVLITCEGNVYHTVNIYH